MTGVNNNDMVDKVDTELTQLNICDQLRANSSFMKIIATLFHYGNQSMNAAQLVVAVRALDLLPLRGETPKSTIQGIISTSRKAARDLKQPDPFHIDKDSTGRQAKYSISDTILNGIPTPPIQELPDEPIILKPVEHSSSYTSAYQLGKRERKSTKFYTPEALRKAHRRRARAQKLKRKQDGGYGDSDSNDSDIDVDTEDGSDAMSLDYSDDEPSALPEQDTIHGYSLLYAPPTTDKNYIDRINFVDYPIASYFAIAQQKGYSYPRFRSHEKIKIPKIHCEDKFRVADITSKSANGTGTVVGRLFILADGHGGRGCSEFFVRKMPEAIQNLCDQYDSKTLHDKDVQARFEKDIKNVVNIIDEEYLAIKRVQLERDDVSKCAQNTSQVNNGAAQTPAVSPTNEDAKDNTAPMQQDSIESTSKCVEEKGDPADQGGAEPMETDPVVKEEAPSSTNTATNGHGEDPPLDAKAKRKLDMAKQEELDNDGCTLVMNLFFGHWLININVGDSRTVLISAPERPKSMASDLDPYTLTCGIDNDYKMDVVFASQDHKPYLEHLAREILENGGEFVDSVQDRVIKVDLDKLREDGNRQAKRVALKNARIRPKDYHLSEHGNSQPHGGQNSGRGNANSASVRGRSREDRVPSLNVARSCGDLDFKMDPNRKIISCEPDVTFFRISDEDGDPSSQTVLTSSLHKAKRRHFLFMGTDGMFDYMYEETPERQNRAVAKVLGPLIEEGEKSGRFQLLEEEAILGGHTIAHNETPQQDTNASTVSTASEEEKVDVATKSAICPSPTPTPEPALDATHKDTLQAPLAETTTESCQPTKPQPLLFREINPEATMERKIRERTLVATARYFANREGANGFFSSTLQDYDDCTIVLIEI